MPVKIKGSEEGVNLFHRRHKIINVKELGTLQTLLYLGSGLGLLMAEFSIDWHSV